MTLTLILDSEIESRLRAFAARCGMDPASVALEAISEKLAIEPAASTSLAPDQWQLRFEEFLATLPRTTTGRLDDSRESIYE